MKRLGYILILLFSISIAANATKWRVNNNSGVTANFTTLKDAVAGAAQGDTIYLESSPNAYGTSDTIKKMLVIIGTGYYKNENLNGVNPTNSKITHIVFETGSEGSLVMSLQIYSSVINANNITITKCYFYDNTDDDNNTIIINGSNIIISKCIITKVNSSDQFNSSIVINGTNAMILNNYIYKYSDYNSSSINCSVASSSTVSQNVLDSNSIPPNNLRNCIFTNNIIKKGIIAVNSNSTVSNNLSYADIGTASGNKSNINMNLVFAGATGNTADSQWKLAVGSPALAAGANGEDCGIYGGSSPYILSGIPAVPLIYELLVPATASGSSGLKITIKAKTQN